MSSAPPLWRAFPWDPKAAGDEPFSAAFIPPRQGHNRFDLPGQPTGVLYLAESADHAIGEKIARFRGRRITERHLREHGRPLALVAVRIAPALLAAVTDLCDPDTLARLRIRPDILASRDRAATQGVAVRLFGELGISGLRWWSAFFGDWHTVALFRRRIQEVDDSLEFGTPEQVGLDTPALAQASAWLGVTIA